MSKRRSFEDKITNPNFRRKINVSNTGSIMPKMKILMKIIITKKYHLLITIQMLIMILLVQIKKNWKSFKKLRFKKLIK